MPNDAKFGLIVGVGLVILVAVVFFRKDPSAVPPAAPAAAAPDAPPPNAIAHRPIRPGPQPPP